MPSITPLNKALILINIVVWGLQYLSGGLVDAYFALWPPQAAQYDAPPFHVWQLLTYGFLHDTHSLLHLFFNMFALYMFGSDIERLFGSALPAAYSVCCLHSAWRFQSAC
jgi:membrane associated rhomboid family serine protease